MKVKLDNLRRLFPRRIESPFLGCRNRRLCEHGMAANETCYSYMPIRRNHDFDFHLAENPHPPCKLGVAGRDLRADLSLTLFDRALLRKPRKRKSKSHRQADGRNRPAMCFQDRIPLNGQDSTQEERHVRCQRAGEELQRGAAIAAGRKLFPLCCLRSTGCTRRECHPAQASLN